MRSGIRFILLLLIISSFGWSKLVAQLTASIEVVHHVNDTAAVINVKWQETDEKAWHDKNDGRLDILGLKTNIRSSDLKKSISGTTTYAFQFEQPSVVELKVEIGSIAPGEQLYLVDIERGNMLFDFGKQTQSDFLTSPFDPSRTLLVWKNLEGNSYKSEFNIENIYYQPLKPGRVLDIGFGTAFPCHPNTACKEDSLLRLISNSTVRMRLVMEEGIGWCSGSFVNNTRNDKKPYVLSAHHCQYDYTPIYDMWRFDFQYLSLTCTNPLVEPQYFSITGCDLVAGGQASDFLLLLLSEDVPLNQEVTFAGWDRDDTARPDTSYLIHHPNADIRKISTSVNEATIHPNQIGWTEGYTTPAHHHFRLKFTEGGHEPGSSGGPLFNQDGYLVGQLHGGTAGCESTNNAFIGRLSKSWSLGATPQERLSDWLDPDQTGLTKISSIENKASGDIVTIHGVVSDPSGRSVKNAVLKVTGSVTETITTAEDGTFQLLNVNRNGQYIITPEKNDFPTNGLNAIDLVAIQKHLLGKDTFDFSWQHVAADATNNSMLSVGDIVVLQRLLLGKIQNLPSSPSWRFDPPQVIIGPIPSGDPAEIDIMCIKIGDLNGTADPKK
jgi:hypothetical protein